MQSTKTTHRHQTDRRFKLNLGIAAGLFLVAMPFLFYAYRLVPDTLETIDFFGFSLGAGAYGNLNYYAYYFTSKTVFLIAFVLWFFTCRYWWRFAILVPIAMLTFQVMGVVNSSIDYIDEFDFLYSLPVVVPVLLFLFYLDKKMRPLARLLDLKDQIDSEIEQLTKD